MFGPVPRDYSFKLNKKVKQLARKSALSYKAINNQIVVLDQFEMAAPMDDIIFANISDFKNIFCFINFNFSFFEKFQIIITRSFSKTYDFYRKIKIFDNVYDHSIWSRSV